MTIQSTDRKAGPFLSGTALPFEFKVFSKEDIAVIYTNAEGVEVVLVLDSDYSVTLNADQDNNPGGTATLTTAIVTGDRANIIGDLAYDQGTDIRNQGGFEPEIIEDALDRATIQIQQLKEISDRTLRTAPGDSRTGDELLADIFEAEENAAASANQAQEILNDIEAAASPLVSQVIAAANSASASAITSGNNATSAGGSEASAAASAAAALAASEASGNVEFFDTSALANAAVAGLPANQVVEVFVDETRSGRRTRYRKEGGVLVFKVSLTQPKIVYLDPDDGLDTNSGLEPTTPVKTFAVANSILQNGDTLRIRGGTRQFVRMNVTKLYVTVDTYGQQGKAFVDGSRRVPNNAWTQDPDNAGVWFADFTHSTTPNGTDNGFCIWEERVNRAPLALVPRWSGADIAANRTFLLTNRDHFTNHRVGSTNKNPTTDTYGTQYRYYVCPPNGENPSTGAIEYYVAEFDQVFNLATGGVARNIIVQRTGAKDLAGHNQNTAHLLEDCEFNDGFVHGWVGGAITLRRCYAKGRRIGGDYTNFGGGGIHLFDDGATQFGFIEDCEVDGYGINFYSHAGTFVTPDHNMVFCRNLKSRNGQAHAFAVGENTKRGVHIDGFESFNDAGGFGLPVGSTVKNFKLRLKNPRNAAFQLSGANGGEVLAENGSVVISGTPVASSGGGSLFINQQASTNGDLAHFITLRMKDVTKAGGSFTSSQFFRQINLIATDCIFGEIDGSGAAIKPFNTFAASRCQLNWYRRSLEEIRLIEPLVGADCIVPWVQQPFVRTISLGDLSFINSGAAVLTPNSADLTHVRFNTMANMGLGDFIKIINYDGLGNDHSGRLVFERSVNNWTIDPAVPVNVPDFKVCHFAYFGRKILPSTSSMTAVFSDDGLQAFFSSTEFLAPGMTVYFGAIGREAPIGARKIVTLSGQTATLDRAVIWNKAPSEAVTFAAFGAVTNNPRPSVSASFVFPIRPVLPDGTFGTTFRIDLSNPVGAADVIGQENNASNIGGRFNLITRTSSFKLLLANGTLVDTGQIKHNIGEIDAGFYPLGPSDILTVTPVCYVEDYDQQFASDPVLSGSTALKQGTTLAGIGIGSKI